MLFRFTGTGYDKIVLLSYSVTVKINYYNCTAFFVYFKLRFLLHKYFRVTRLVHTPTPIAVAAER